MILVISWWSGGSRLILKVRNVWHRNLWVLVLGRVGTHGAVKLEECSWPCSIAAQCLSSECGSIWSRIYTWDVQPRIRASPYLELTSLLCRLGSEQGSLWSVGVLCTGMKTLWGIFFWAVSHTVQIWVSHHCHRVSLIKVLLLRIPG